MQNNSEYKNKYTDINECTSRGACSVSPTIASLEKLSLKFLFQISYYLIKLEELGASNDKIKNGIITVLASHISINEFSENQLFEIIMEEYFTLEETIKTYKNLCKKNDIKSKELKKIEGFTNKTTLPKAIALGEKLFYEKGPTHSSKQKNLSEILLIVIKSVSLNLLKLKNFETPSNEFYHSILEALSMFNAKTINLIKISDKISLLANLDKELQIKVSEKILNTFEGIDEVKVSHSSRKGKAILVSGNNFFDLLNILEETKDKNIDIYTNSNLLITHALNKFRSYEHLRGHYASSTANCILDFATFPGAILLTKNSQNNTEYLYRGRLFSNDYIVPNGVIKIENDNYDDLIKSALNAKGFSKGKIKDTTTLGYNEKTLLKKLKNLSDKFNNNSIKRLYIIGLDAHKEDAKAYFKDLFTKLQDDEFVISFSYESKKKNVLTLNLGNYLPLATNILAKLFKHISIKDSRITFLFSTCDVMTISNIIMLKNLKVQNIYMTKCSPTIVNPSVFETFNKTYHIKICTNAIKDLSEIRAKKITQ